jgi:UDP-N-acetylglucosamine 2-epimerase (non-hydrolysing)
MKRLPVADNVILSEPLGYRDFLSLMSRARLVITDSGGVQEETCWLGIQCLTIRPSTERPVTIECGTNRLVGCTRDEIVAASESALADSARTVTCPVKWDGKTAHRIIEILKTAV